MNKESFESSPGERLQEVLSMIQDTKEEISRLEQEILTASSDQKRDFERDLENTRGTLETLEAEKEELELQLH